MKEQILALRAEGKSYREIQEILKCSKGTISYHCGKGQIQKHNKRQNLTRSERRTRVDKLKKSPCVDCGGSFPPECMDYDHLDSNSKVNHVSQLVSHGSWQDVLDEIAKCELVCANCHRIRTKRRGGLAQR